MNREDYIDDVLSRLSPSLVVESIQSICEQIGHMHADGWSAADAASFVRCMEEYSPNLDEDKALARMEQLGRKYKLRDLAIWLLTSKRIGLE